MPTNLNIHVNTTAVDATRLAQPANYVLMDLANDKLIWSAGGTAAVIDGADTPNTAELDEAATIIGSVDTEIDKLFLLDFSDVGLELKLVDLAGSGDNQHVICLEFDAATASEPRLESFDDNGHVTANLNVLGAGTPADSMVKGVLTTAVTPGLAWVGTPIAGSLAPNVLELNGGGGALLVATDVYVNLKVLIPASFSVPFSESPVITIRYTFS
jgi:hypothetical protein